MRGVVPALALLFLVGCGTSVTPTPVPSSSWVSLLQLLPDTAETHSYLHMNDYALARELFDVPLPGQYARTDAVIEDYVLALIPISGEGSRLRGDSTFISGMSQHSLRMMESFREHLSFDARNVDQTAYAGAPPGALEVVRGRFDPEDTERALARCSECPPPLIEEHRGISFYSWGEDLQLDMTNRLTPPAFDQLGRGGRIAVQEEYVLRTVETPGMRALIDAAEGGHSLADVEEYVLVAQGLEDLGAYAAFVSDQTQSIAQTLEQFATSMTAKEAENIESRLRQEPALEPYQVFATGPGLDEKGHYMAVVLVHASESGASRNVELIRQRVRSGTSMFTRQTWAELINDVESRSQDRVLLAKLRGERAASLWLNFVVQRDPLLLHR